MKPNTTIFIAFLLLVTSCTNIPEGVKPINDFELKRYLGTWYEIARLPHSFEEGLEQVTATYTLKEDGGVKVINKGYDPISKKWEQADGNAYFVGDESIGHLKVSFFGPFYASYVILELDANGYQYALVSGPDREYMWLLSRSKTLTSEVTEMLLGQAKSWGFPTEKLIWVKHI